MKKEKQTGKYGKCEGKRRKEERKRSNGKEKGKKSHQGENKDIMACAEEMFIHHYRGNFLFLSEKINYFWTKI